ncbi:MAG: T9SS type A sorting domain-containing protein [Bacteroidales bacterium]|nr:T9SS type A sorting domain-containing protein [Bacteroidales bacterium]
MKKIFILSLLLSLCFQLFSQVYDVIFKENGEPFGIKVFDGESVRKIRFDELSDDGRYEIILGDKTIIFDFNQWEQQNQELQANQYGSALEIFEPGLLPEGDLIRAFSYSPDGSILATLYQHSDNVYFYNTTNYEVLAIVDLGREPMDIKMTTHSAYICCHTSNEVNIIDLSDFSISNSFEVFEYPCQVEVNQDETVVYVACDSFLNGSIAAYNSSSGEEIFHTYEPYIHHGGMAGGQGRTSYSFTEFSLSPHSNYIIAINTNGKVPSVFNSNTGELVKTFNFGGGMRGSGFSETGDTLYIYSTQHPDCMSLHRININDLSVIDSIIAITSEAGIIGRTDIAINADGTKVLTGGDFWNSRYCFFDFNSYDYHYINDLNILGISNIYTSYDKRYAISQVLLIAQLIDMETGQIINRTPIGMPIGVAGATSPIEDKMALSDGPFYSLPEYPEEKFYFFDFSDHINFNTDTVIIAGNAPEADMTNCAVLSNDGNKIIATNTLTDNVSIIDFVSGQLDTLIYMEGVSDVKTIPNSDLILVSGQDAISIKIMDLTTNGIVSELFTGNADDVFVTADGKNAYVFEIMSSLGSVKKIDINGASSQITGDMLVGYSNCSYHIIFSEVDIHTTTAISPDGNYMLFGAEDNIQGDVIYVVDTRIMEVVDTVPVNNDCVYGYAFTDDSKRVCALVYDSQIPIIYLDGENSYVESEVSLENGSFSVDFNPADSLFYILLKSDWLYQVNPNTGEILNTLPTNMNHCWQVGFDQNGIPLIRSSKNLIYESESYPLPGVSEEFSYNEENNLFIIPIPGPDKVCVFDPLAVSIKTYPSAINKESVRVFPNPARGEVFIYSENIIGSVGIYDSEGKLVFSKDCNKLNTSVSVSNYKEGAYFIIIRNNSGITTRKLIIVHQ